MPESNLLQQFKLTMKNLDINLEMSENFLTIALRDVKGKKVEDYCPIT